MSRLTMIGYLAAVTLVALMAVGIVVVLGAGMVRL